MATQMIVPQFQNPSKLLIKDKVEILRGIQGIVNQV